MRHSPQDWAQRFPGTGGALYGQASHGWRASFSRPAAVTRLPGLFLAGGSTHPGAGVPMAVLSGLQAAGQVLARHAGPARWPDFDHAVAPGGCAWCYLDALSDDGRHALVAIVFIGSVFSPCCAWAQRWARRWAQRGGGAAAGAPCPGADPRNHVAVNVALYRTDGGPGERWAMTERGSAALQRSADTLAIGPSSLHRDGHARVLRLDEWTVPLPRRLRGTVRLHPLARGLDSSIALEPRGLSSPIALERSGAHQWWPIAP